jgi:hypothetical protein
MNRLLGLLAISVLIPPCTPSISRGDDFPSHVRNALAGKLRSEVVLGRKFRAVYHDLVIQSRLLDRDNVFQTAVNEIRGQALDRDFAILTSLLRFFPMPEPDELDRICDQAAEIDQRLSRLIEIFQEDHQAGAAGKRIVSRLAAIQKEHRSNLVAVRQLAVEYQLVQILRAMQRVGGPPLVRVRRTIDDEINELLNGR